MATTLIRLNDGTFVEVDVPADKATPVAGGFATKLDEGIDVVKPALLRVCRPIVDAWAELNKEMYIEQAEVTLEMSFDVEGNLYLTKAKTSAHMTIKLILKAAVPTEEEPTHDH